MNWAGFVESALRDCLATVKILTHITFLSPLCFCLNSILLKVNPSFQQRTQLLLKVFLEISVYFSLLTVVWQKPGYKACIASACTSTDTLLFRNTPQTLTRSSALKALVSRDNAPLIAS